MAQKLTIDRGNTTTKVAVWDGMSLLFSRFIANATVEELMGVVEGYDIDAAILCSVAGGMPRLEEHLRRRDVSMLWLTSATPLPIGIDYDTPATLGADRVAAAAGAAARYPGRDVFIVDIGTAITYDFVDASGVYRGGNIAPGIGMRLNALHTFTNALPKVSSKGDTPVWGHSTETAMRAGAIRGVIGEITYYHSLLKPDAVMVLTGGWSADIAAQLPFSGAKVDANLVTFGLNSILLYNESLR